MSLPTRLWCLLVVPAGVLVIGCMPSSTPTDSSPIVPLSPAVTIPQSPLSIPTTSLAPARFTSECIRILDAPPNDVILRYSLLLSSTSSDSYILNLETNERTFIDNTRLGEFSVAPGMRKLAHIDYESGTLAIRDVNGDELQVFDGYAGRPSLVEWLDDEKIAINEYKEEKPGYTDYSLSILDTLEGTVREFDIGDMPNGNGNPKVVSWNYYGNIIPNAQLTKVIYPIEGRGYPIVLWDLESGIEKRRIYFSYSRPMWSPDGTGFIVIAPLNFGGFVNFTDDLPYQGGYEIFYINEQGDIRRLTYITTKYEESVFSAPSYSPKGDYLAINIHNRNQTDFGLSVLNVATGEITNYCIHDNWGLIFWSPDQSQIAFTRGNGFEPFRAKAYVLDLRRKTAFKIADDASVAGWMQTE